MLIIIKSHRVILGSPLFFNHTKYCVYWRARLDRKHRVNDNKYILFLKWTSNLFLERLTVKDIKVESSKADTVFGH